MTQIFENSYKFDFLSRPVLKYYKSRPDAITPIFATNGAACFDFYACKPDYFEGLYIELPSGGITLVPTGLKFDIPKGHHIKIYNRSSMPLKKGLILANGVGVVDEDYVDEVFGMFYNSTKETQYIKVGDRIMQGELVSNSKNFCFEEIKKASEKKGNRTGGLGSTGNA